MTARIKIRSVSVEDLGNIVKRMIDGVLEDNDQVAKLRQAVYEEYYLKKMEEFRSEKSKIDADYKVIEKTIDESESENSLRKYNIETGDTETRADDVIKTIDDFPNCKESLDEQLNSEKLDEKKALSNIDIHEVNSPVVRVLRRQKYVKLVKNDDIRVTEICNSNIALGLANHNTTMNLTQTVNDSPATELSKEEVEKTEKEVANNLEIIEWQNRKLCKRNSEICNESGEPREIQVQFKSKGEIAFENWKKEKTDVYNRVFREDQKRRRIEKIARSKEIEKKESAKEAYLYWRKQQDNKQKFNNNNRKKILAQMELQKLECCDKRRENTQAFKIWKKQKDIKLRERKMYMMAYNDQNYLRQQSKPRKPEPSVDIAFDIWLDQLDCVLHQKYLRERRYLVRSFYCQPAYFGTAALCGR